MVARCERQQLHCRAIFVTMRHATSSLLLFNESRSNNAADPTPDISDPPACPSSAASIAVNISAASPSATLVNSDNNNNNNDNINQNHITVTACTDYGSSANLPQPTPAMGPAVAFTNSTSPNNSNTNNGIYQTDSAWELANPRGTDFDQESCNDWNALFDLA